MTLNGQAIFIIAVDDKSLTVREKGFSTGVRREEEGQVTRTISVILESGGNLSDFW